MSLISIKIDKKEYQALQANLEEMLRYDEIMSHGEKDRAEGKNPFGGMHASGGPVTQEEVSRILSFMMTPNSYNYENIKDIQITSEITIEQAWNKLNGSRSPDPVDLVKMIDDTLNHCRYQTETEIRRISELIMEVKQAEDIMGSESYVQ